MLKLKISLTNRYPWLVAIKRTVDDGNPPRFFTGTLVSDQYVVTTANVVDNQAYNKEQFEVRPGATAHDPNKNDLMAWQRVAEIRSHPFYKHRKKPSNELSYNVGLLKLMTRVDFFHFLNGVGVGPICLPTPKQTNKEDLREKQVFTFKELGGNDIDEVHGEKIQTPVDEECSGWHGRSIARDQLCADRLEANTCYSDNNVETGKPLFIEENNRYGMIH